MYSAATLAGANKTIENENRAYDNKDMNSTLHSLILLVHDSRTRRKKTKDVCAVSDLSTTLYCRKESFTSRIFVCHFYSAFYTFIYSQFVEIRNSNRPATDCQRTYCAVQ